MRNRSFVIVAVVVGLLLAIVVASWAYDSSKKDQIAKGVTAGGIDVGGMSKDEARQVLREKLARPLNEPLIVKYGHRKFTLSAARAHLTTDIDGMVHEAIDKSRGGNIITRSFRGITGGSVDANVPSRVEFDQSAVRALVRRVKRKVDRQPRDATVQPDSAGLHTVPAKLVITAAHVPASAARRAPLVFPPLFNRPIVPPVVEAAPWASTLRERRAGSALRGCDKDLAHPKLRSRACR